MTLFARWMRGKEGGTKSPPGAQIIQMALKLHQLPTAVEELDLFWFNRLQLWVDAEIAADKLK